MYRNKETRQSYSVFTDNLKKGEFKNVIFMYGVEQFLVRWAVDSLVRKYVNPAVREMDYISFDSDLNEPLRIIEAAETFSMFSEKRIVYVPDFKPLTSENPRGINKAQIQSLCEYLKSSNESTIIVFSSSDYSEDSKKNTELVNTIKTCGQVYNFKEVDRRTLEGFAKKRFASAKVNITPAALRMLIEETGYTNKESDYHLYNFENDIKKIISLCQGDTVDISQIENAVCADNNTFIFDMLDAISANQKDKAFQILHNKLYQGDEEFNIIGSIISQFELMISVRQLSDDGFNLLDMHRKLGGSEYRIKKMLPYARKYSASKLKEILSNAYEIEKNIKTGLMMPQLALEIFIASI